MKSKKLNNMKHAYKLKKKLGLPIAAEKVDGRGTVYKLDAA